MTVETFSTMEAYQLGFILNEYLEKLHRVVKISIPYNENHALLNNFVN